MLTKLRNKYIDDRAFYRMMLAIAIPLIIHLMRQINKYAASDVEAAKTE